MIEDLKVPEPHLRPFPEPETVFAGDAAEIELAARYLSPLVSIDLSAINPAWVGWAHLLSPIEPTEGYVGAYGSGSYSYYCRENWLGFRLNADEHYEFLAEWDYFQAHRELAEAPADRDEYLIEHYETQHESYLDHKVLCDAYHRLLEPGITQRMLPDQALAHAEPFLYRAGGGARYSNWVGSGDMPLNEDDPEDIYPIGPDGERFYFVAETPGWRYREAGADSILMFFEPTSRVVLFTFDWT